MDHQEHADLRVEDDSDAAGPSTPLLSQNEDIRRASIAMSLTTGGKLRAYYLGVVVCIGGFLCTYGEIWDGSRRR